jgi:hypothetical protein
MYVNFLLVCCVYNGVHGMYRSGIPVVGNFFQTPHDWGTRVSCSLRIFYLPLTSVQVICMSMYVACLHVVHLSVSSYCNFGRLRIARYSMLPFVVSLTPHLVPHLTQTVRMVCVYIDEVHV